MEAMVGIKSRALLMSDSDDVLDQPVAAKRGTEDCGIKAKGASPSETEESNRPSAGGDNDGADGPEEGEKAGTVEGATGIKLMDMIKEGVLAPGVEVLLWKYKGFRQLADLREDGIIEIAVDGKRKTFETPTALAGFMARLRGSSRKSCNGWWEILYKGAPAI